MVEMCTHLAIERARTVTLHLQRARRSSIPTTGNWHTLQEELRVAKKRVMERYRKAFLKMAVERLKSCDNILVLAEELGLHGDCFTNCVISWNRRRMAKDRRPTFGSESCGDRLRSNQAGSRIAAIEIRAHRKVVVHYMNHDLRQRT